MAVATARRFAFKHELIQTAELDNPAYRANDTNRCYYCKHELYTRLTTLAQARGFAAVADGNNADDRGDYRPGRQAAREFGVRLDVLVEVNVGANRCGVEPGVPAVALALLKGGSSSHAA